MRILTGREITEVDVGESHRLTAACAAVALDLGTGDGRSVVRAARRRLDANPTGMRRASGHAPANAIFVVAAAESLPAELDETVSALSAYLLPVGLAAPFFSGGLVAPSREIVEGPHMTGTAPGPP